ncbi:unnamed protein product [Sphagnum jensenii]|uniref:RING-type domain-containing protein n=1 Tax=Sphagnum jensenii TaxID=128206 RepID=A0ABP0W7Z2_9BRYO
MATVIIVVLVSVFVFVVFFFVYLKRCIREVEQADGSSSSTRTGPAAVALPLPTAAAVSGSDDHHHHRLPLELQRGGVGQGLNKALVEALPILSFSVVKDLRKRGRSEGGSKESLDCAVCLNEFGKDENLLLRLLPACNHAFHVDCIDVWFQSHSTCPLCRSSLLPIFKEQLTDDDDDDGGGGGGGVAAAAVTVEEAASRRILEAQGQNCASGAAARDGRRILLPESWSSSLTGTGRQSASVEQISAEEEEEGSGGGGDGSSDTRIVRRAEDSRHNSSVAKLALSRNSESFRLAARVAASSATYPSLAPTLDKGPRQTSSSLKLANLTGMEYYSIEMLPPPYESQRFGPAIGTGEGEEEVVDDVGDSSAIFAVELQQRVQNNSVNLLSPGGGCEDNNEYVLSGFLTSPRDEEDEWITIDVALDQNAAPQTQQTATLKLPRREMMQEEGRRIIGKSSSTTMTVNLGEPAEVRMGSDRWSFSSLRGPFSLTRSASEGRRQQRQLLPPTTMHAEGAYQAVVVPASRTAAWNPLEQQQQQQQSGGDAAARGRSSSRTGPNQSFARRAMLWLAGREGEKL